MLIESVFLENMIRNSKTLVLDEEHQPIDPGWRPRVLEFLKATKCILHHTPCFCVLLNERLDLKERFGGGGQENWMPG